MKYLIDKNNNVICTADDEYEFMLHATANDYPDSQVVAEVPRPIVEAADVQPTTTGTVTV
jgi:hypothetical protein